MLIMGGGKRRSCSFCVWIMRDTVSYNGYFIRENSNPPQEAFASMLLYQTAWHHLDQKVANPKYEDDRTG